MSIVSPVRSKVSTREAIQREGGRPSCQCHGEPMRWNPDARYVGGGHWHCSVRARAYEAAYRATPEGDAARRESTLRSALSRLERGEQVKNYANHHAAMAELKAQLGDPRPPGLTLSLANFDSPFAYWGVRAGKFPHRLSTDPDDYVWETQAENNRRQRRES